MYEVNNTFQINGKNGKYDNSVTNPSVRYGRNAVDNYYAYMEQPIVNDKFNPPPILDTNSSEQAQENNVKQLENYIKNNDEYLNALPPLEFEYRYMPTQNKGEVDRQALLGAAYEEMEGNIELPVEVIDENLGNKNIYTSKALDLNNDGKVDIGEYSSSILASDMMSNDSHEIDGIINNKGMNVVLEYSKISNLEQANKLYSKLYNEYNLKDAIKEFQPE